MGDSVWATMANWQLVAIAFSFVWSGFVRSGLGFGGAALTLPLLLAIHNDLLLFLPALCWQLLIFSSLTVSSRLSNVNWSYLWHLIIRSVLPFAAGLIGLLSLSAAVLSLFVYSVTLVYGVMYAMNKIVTSKGRFTDALCLILGGYASGVSLIGAPLYVAYSTRRLAASQLRDTLFVMWIFLVCGKLSTFALAGVDLQWQLSATTLPLVGIGHYMGLRAHRHLLSGDPRRFYQVIGSGLGAVSIIGLWSAF